MKKIFLLLIVMIVLVPFVLGDTVSFVIENSETLEQVSDAIIILNGLSDPTFSSVQISNAEGEASFLNVPNFMLYSYVVVHDDFEDYSSVIFVDGNENIYVPLTPLGDFAWQDVFVQDDNIEGSWYSNDEDTIYFGGERMNHVTTVTNIRSSGNIIFDYTTSVQRRTFESDGSSTDWNSAHTPDSDQMIELKPEGRITTTFSDDEMQICITKAIIHLSDFVIELFGEEHLCQTENRNENVIPYYLDGEYYINTTSTYKIGNNHYTLSAVSPNFFIINNLTGENHPPLLNNHSPIIVAEGEMVNINQIILDPDNDPLIVTMSDARFDFVGIDGNSYNFEWQTEEGDAGTYLFDIIVSDGEFETAGVINVTVLNSFVISLEEGYNLISLPLSTVVVNFDDQIIFNNETEIITANIEDELIDIYFYDSGEWLSYNAGEIPFLNPNKAYWFLMDGSVELNIKGYVQMQEFELNPGLNMIGYPSDNIFSSENVFSNVEGSFNSVLSYETETDEWILYSPDAPNWLNTLDEMVPGKGYWVVANNAMLWNFDEEGFILGRFLLSDHNAIFDVDYVFNDLFPRVKKNDLDVALPQEINYQPTIAVPLFEEKIQESAVLETDLKKEYLKSSKNIVTKSINVMIK
jgi:hypothetical protein